ncbi:TIGR00341 family protein [Arabiibacter massiliensis]|uniref:TIGR00341 family protein n=1 Tax=Arabiibacter massiliensis TaxID=1870985 RepID=UPI0009B9DAE0|nr:TIGR00341 family protein [Arabiibacter massiliensis]
MNRIARILAGGSIDEAIVAVKEQSMFVATDDPVKRYSSFFICIVLSAVIATGGIAAESTAIVIGAMLIAPLMAPIVGTSFAIVTGRPKKAAKTLAVALAGALAVISTAYVVAALVPTGVTLAGNPEVEARTAPRVVDLVVAVASGFVGALAMARDDIAEAVPGVAVAVSIVPPLCVVGAALFAGDLTAASGALLLFLVNFAAIQLAGNAAFFLMGFGRRRTSEAGARVRRIWYATAIAGTLLLAAPLMASSNELARNAADEQSVKAAVRTWLDGTGYEAISVKMGDNAATVQIAGAGAYPSAEELTALMAERGVHAQRARILVMREYEAETS